MAKTEEQAPQSQAAGKPGDQASMEQFNPGDRVVAKGLVGAKNLNGSFGKVLNHNEDKGRYGVQFAKELGSKLLKAENLTLAVASHEGIKQIFDAHGKKAARKLKDLNEEIGFGLFANEDLRKLVADLLQAGYWAESPEEEEYLKLDLKVAEHPAAAKLARLKQSNDLGFARYDDSELRDFLRKLLDMNWRGNDAEEQQTMRKELEIAELPRGIEAIKFIQKLEMSDEDTLRAKLDEMGEVVKKDAALSHVFDELGKIGHKFEFERE